MTDIKSVNMPSSDISGAISELGSALALILSEIRDGTLPKTILLEGKDAAARHKAAVLCACALVCEAEGESIPCGRCESCRRALAEKHSDVTVLGCTFGEVKLADVRKARADAFVSPFEAERRVFIFDGAQGLNVQSQNALLKILEEPPERAYFILTAPSSRMLLETVNSRCTVFRLGSPTYGDIYSAVCEALPNAENDKKSSLAHACLYLDGFEITAQTLSRLETALAVCEEYYSGKGFPFGSLPTRKEDTETLKLIFKALSLCALEVCRAKKGTDVRDGILSARTLETAVMKMPIRTAFSRSEFFERILCRLEENANVGAVLAVVRTELCGV